jgi:hypothetical protein
LERHGPVKRVLPDVAIAVGCLLLLLGSVAGVVNRQVLDGPRFAHHVESMRTDPDVTRELGRAITTRVLELDPDLVAVRPLVESVATAAAGSPALRPVVLRAARQLHAALTSPSSAPLVLQLADVGAVLTASLRVAAPDLAASLPATFDVTLARIGSGSFADSTARFAHHVELLAWLLPLGGLLLIGIGVGTSRDRPAAGTRAGFGVVAAGVVLGSATVALGIVAHSLAQRPELRPVLVAAAWRELDGPLWWMTAALVVCGAITVIACAQLAAPVSAGAQGRTWRSLVVATTPAGLVGRAAVLALVGVALIARPELVIRLVAGSVGLVLLLLAVADLLAARSAAAASGGLRLSRRLALVALLPPVFILLAILTVNADPGEERIEVASTQVAACNGHRELCSRPYDEVAFPATHNSMTAADENWYLPEQPTGIVGQLDDGIRVFLIDSWYGQTTSRPSVIVTAEASKLAALAEANAEYGSAVVQSALRLRDAASLTPTGPRTPYLCHSLCELGAVRWDTEMTAVQEWLAVHPREVVTFFVQDEVSPADTEAVFRTAGLLPYVHTQREGRPWPTLGQMIDSGRRVVVLMENHGGGTAYPWLLQGFDWVQDTPYENPTVADLSCRLERGSADDPILLVNHWLGGYRTLVTDARVVNARRVLLSELRRCSRERGHLPNFVAVNFYDQGDLFSVIDTLNGF